MKRGFARHLRKAKEPDFLGRDDKPFRKFPKNADQNLGWHCDLVAHSFKQLKSIGLIPAPYSAMRIAILLRKAKEREREGRFLRAWCRHFHSGTGVTYGKLVERARKLGAIGG